MHIISDVPPPARASRDNFAGSARIAVKYADCTAAMPLIRLDRNGLTVAVADDVDTPTIGLPRRAMIVCDSVPLCELRLVARAASREPGRPTTVTLQPSRADDHAQLWQALRASEMQWEALPSSLPSTADLLPEQAPALDASAHDSARLNTDTCNDNTESPTVNAADLGGSVSCDAAFSLARDDDAWLFARWLDYHFAEVRARSRMSGAAADLRDVSMRVVGHEVEVRFLFQSRAPVVGTSTELACRWIAGEAARQLGIAVEHWSHGTPRAYGSPTH